MPWKETCRMDEKFVFVADCLRGELPMAALCEDYGISRKTGYKWLGRYREQGPEGLVERSRAPHRHGRSMAPETAEAIVALRRQRPHWGPRKLRAALMRSRPEAVWPAASTMGDLLRAEGLVSSRRRRRRRVAAPGRPFRAVTAPNDVWCIDFKGWFRTRDGERCDPLTVSDAHSRFLLACVIVPPRTDTVRVAVEQLFKRYGLPLAIRSDNGAPFAGTGAGGLSRLSVGWDQGRHRVGAHRAGPAAAERTARAHASDLEGRDGQTAGRECGPAAGPLRPLPPGLQRQPSPRGAGQQPPAAFYRPSPRPYPERLDEPWYDAWHAMRRVRTDGSIKWGGDLVFISETLKGEPVGIAETDSGDWIVRFADIDLGDHRSPDEKTSWLPRGPAGPRGSQTHQEHCYPCNRSIVLPKLPVAQRSGRRAAQTARRHLCVRSLRGVAWATDDATPAHSAERMYTCVIETASRICVEPTSPVPTKRSPHISRAMTAKSSPPPVRCLTAVSSPPVCLSLKLSVAVHPGATGLRVRTGIPRRRRTYRLYW